MNCRDIKEWLTDNFTATPLETTDEIAAHLDECPDCKAYFEGLLSLSAAIAPLADISMTDEESARLDEALNVAMQTAVVPDRQSRRKRTIFSIVRVATAIAAMFLIVTVSFHTNSVDTTWPVYNIDDFELTGTSVQDLAPLFVNDNGDLLPSMVDQQSATYLTDQIDPAQAEDILESETSEEIEWLMKNYSMEI
jgi:predicted anti-sigma-YlaC factor YlaD